MYDEPILRRCYRRQPGRACMIACFRNVAGLERTSVHRERPCSVHIAEYNPHSRTTDAGVHNLTQCLIVEVHERRCRRGRRWTLIGLEGRQSRGWRWWSLRTTYLRRRPRADPALIVPALGKHRRMDRKVTKSDQNEDNEYGLLRRFHALFSCGSIIPSIIQQGIALLIQDGVANRLSL